MKGDRWCWMLVQMLVMMLTNLEGTICDYCGKDFLVLERRVWRGKTRVFIDAGEIKPR